MEKLCSFELKKTTQIIHGNVRLHTGRSAYEQRHFLESVLLKELIPQMKASWPEAKGRIHIDAWREVSLVDQFSITIEDRDTVVNTASENYFFNLGGIKNEFEEYHYRY
jgi:hypothetical protein